MPSGARRRPDPANGVASDGIPALFCKVNQPPMNESSAFLELLLRDGVVRQHATPGFTALAGGVSCEIYLSSRTAQSGFRSSSARWRN